MAAMTGLTSRAQLNHTSAINPGWRWRASSGQQSGLASGRKSLVAAIGIRYNRQHTSLEPKRIREHDSSSVLQRYPLRALRPY
jgi:hypothetical protein